MSALPYPRSRPNSKPVDPNTPINVSDNYVSYTLKNTKPLPPITLKNFIHEINWISLLALTLTPFFGVFGACYVKLRWETALWSVGYYFCTGLGITAGYHRLWAHRSYNASLLLRVVLSLFGAGAVQGSIKWWSRDHRAHHRYTDTPLDPYNAQEGFWWSHIGWVLVKPRIRPGVAEVSDLRKDRVVRWQHKYYIWLLLTMAFVFPTAVAWIGWDDPKGGLVYAGLLRLVFVHHSTFCVNSLAHWMGETSFDDKHTPRDHMITALVTVGEGYHNFHHQFPTDYRNAIKWYQYDPTKWFIYTMSLFRLASHLKAFPSNEIRKGALTMELKRLRETQKKISWPRDNEELPVVSWDAFQTHSQTRPLILTSGFIHDMTDFLEEHPGGKHLLVKFIGKDATTAFFGGVYDHSNAAHNLLAMKRVGILHGGHPHAADIKVSDFNKNPKMDLTNDQFIPPSQRLKIAKYEELTLEARRGYPNKRKPTYDMTLAGYNSGYGSTTAVESDEDEREEEDYKEM